MLMHAFAHSFINCQFLLGRDEGMDTYCNATDMSKTGCTLQFQDYFSVFTRICHDWFRGNDFIASCPLTHLVSVVHHFIFVVVAPVRTMLIMVQEKSIKKGIELLRNPTAGLQKVLLEMW